MSNESSFTKEPDWADVRKAHPYDLYDTLDWEVPVFQGGDVYDRFRVRMAEIRQSLSMIRQPCRLTAEAPALKTTAYSSDSVLGTTPSKRMY